MRSRLRSLMVCKGFTRMAAPEDCDRMDVQGAFWRDRADGILAAGGHQSSTETQPQQFASCSIAALLALKAPALESERTLPNASLMLGAAGAGMLLQNASAVISLLSDWLFHGTVQERTNAGRTLVASESVAAGAIVMSDVPFALALNERHRQQVRFDPLADIMPSA